MAKDKKVRINVGIPGSGKSTESQDFVSKNPTWVKIGRDDFRYMLKNAGFLDYRAENLVTILLFESCRKALLSGYNVILDNTHCKRTYINDAIEKLNDLASIEFAIYNTPLEVCLERDAVREKKVGETVIKRMYGDFTKLTETYDFPKIPKRERIKKDQSVDWNPLLPDAVVFDIDGTLAHMDGKRGPFDWNKVDIDRIDKVVAKQFRMHKASGDTVLVVSGRDGSCRDLTDKWLKSHGLEHDGLFMRPAGDFRKDNLIKEEIYNTELKDKYNIIVIYDDRDQVVNMWRSLGLKVFQVETGEF